MREFFFIYNAKGGKFNEILDFIHKKTSPSTYNCSLCMITYNFKMKEKWKNFLKNSSHKFLFLHIEDLVKYKLEKFKNDLPICLEKIDDNFEIIIDSATMNQLQDQDDLITLFEEKTKLQ